MTPSPRGAPSPLARSPTPYGLWSGVGVNVGVMIGVGVFVSAGFMASSLGPVPILLAWLVGGVLAMAGARAYAEVARLVPRSGGEYRYLSTLVHPALGYLAGWTTVLAGFSAPIASNAAIAGPFAQTLIPSMDPRYVSIGLVVLVTAMHAFDLRLSKRSQDLLAALKVILLAGFIAVGLALGRAQAPTWTPPQPAPDLLGSFMANLVYVMYAYTGWNTAVYAAEEFRAPKTIARSMTLAVLAVGAIYLLLNWVFVANLDAASVEAFLKGDNAKVTLAHVVARGLVGSVGADVMSALVVLVLFSGMSSMAMIGPRVCAAMAQDGFLPRRFAAQAGRPPMFSVLFLGALSLTLVLTYTADALITHVGLILTLMSILTGLALFKARFERPRRCPPPRASSLIAASVFACGCGWMLYAAVAERPSLLVWMAALAAVSSVAYAAHRTWRVHP